MFIMKKRKRIALFAGQSDESYQSRFISGFLKNAFAGGYDVCVFSMYRKYQDTQEREWGESNIFSLMAPDKFDGAVILKRSYQNSNNDLSKYHSDNQTIIEKRAILHFGSIALFAYWDK